jgi:hypothetical protein
MTGIIALAGLTLVVNAAARADEDVEWVTKARGRYEIAIGVHSWPGIADLEPARAGGFEDVGFNLSAAGHWPLQRFGASELLLGIDLGLFSNESDLRFITDDVMARGGYITPSIKWMFGHRHRYSLDAGVGYYMVDIAEIAGEYPLTIETQLWENGAVGGYAGITVDFNGGVPTNSRGVMLTFKTHFFELDAVSDEEPFFPATLGPDAGDLSGPVYMLQVGYRWR